MPQVHNRDLSVLVLEEFVALWRAETATAAPPAPADPSQADAPAEATTEKPAGAPKADADASTADAPSRRGKRGVGARVLGGGGSGLRVLDALSASGLRAIRYAKEVRLSAIISRRVSITVAIDPSDRIGLLTLGGRPREHRRQRRRPLSR